MIDKIIDSNFQISEEEDSVHSEYNFHDQSETQFIPLYVR